MSFIKFEQFVEKLKKKKEKKHILIFRKLSVGCMQRIILGFCQNDNNVSVNYWFLHNLRQHYVHLEWLKYNFLQKAITFPNLRKIFDTFDIIKIISIFEHSNFLNINKKYHFSCFSYYLIRNEDFRKMKKICLFDIFPTNCSNLIKGILKFKLNFPLSNPANFV